MSHSADPEGRHGSVHCVGLATLDIVLGVESLPRGPGKSFAASRREIGGGPAATAAVCVARLGGRAVFAGRLGEDRIGDILVEELAAEGVDTRWLRRFAGAQSPSSAVIVEEGGERSIVAFSDASMPADAGWLAPELAEGAVLADMSWPEGARSLFARAEAAGLPRVLDADRFRHPPDTARAVVAAASHVIFSRQGLAQLTGEAGIEQGLASVAGTRAAPHVLLAVTDGEHGVFWREAGRLGRQRPPRIVARDTTGAGDAFHGAFALALARGHGIVPSLRFATAVAAAKCLTPGGRAGLPDEAALAAFLAAHPLPEPD